MRDIVRLLQRWQLNVGDARERMYRAPIPRERERWHAAVQEKLGHFFTQLAYRTEEVRHRCQTALQARPEELLKSAPASSYRAIHVDPTLALV